MKFNVNDEVVYTNKHYGKDFRITGKIIGTSYWDPSSFVVELPENNHSGFSSFSANISGHHSFVESASRPVDGAWRNNNERIAEGTRGQRRYFCYVPKRSRNLMKASIDYDPSQNGDTEEDI